jgi:hypothetical protein
MVKMLLGMPQLPSPTMPPTPSRCHLYVALHRPAGYISDYVQPDQGVFSGLREALPTYRLAPSVGDLRSYAIPSFLPEPAKRLCSSPGCTSTKMDEALRFFPRPERQLFSICRSRGDRATAGVQLTPGDRPRTLATMLDNSDLASLQKIHGIGPKTAQK